MTLKVYLLSGIHIREIYIHKPRDIWGGLPNVQCSHNSKKLGNRSKCPKKAPHGFCMYTCNRKYIAFSSNYLLDTYQITLSRVFNASCINQYPIWNRRLSFFKWQVIFFCIIIIVNTITILLFTMKGGGGWQ